MRRITQHNLITFFSLMFLLPWLVWGTTIAQQHALLGWHLPQALAFWLGITVAVYTSAALDGGKPAVKDLLSRLIRVKVAPVWYLAAFCLLPVIGLASILIYTLGGGNVILGKDLAAAGLVPIFLIEFWLFLLTEETAWRGYALPRLQSVYSPLKASIVLGVVWALWHMPLFFINGSFQSSIPYGGFLISTIAMSVITTWLFNNARGSVLIVAILHASTDVAIAYLGVMSTGRTLFWIFVLLQACIAARIASRPGFRNIVDGNPELTYKPTIRSS